MKELILIIALVWSFDSSAQVKNAKKFVGKWSYKYDLGVEYWSVSNGELRAEAYRMNKLGDSTKVEEVRIFQAGKLLVHEWTTYNVVEDSLIINDSKFVSTSKALKFHNVDGLTPNTISYSFGFLNRNKLKIRVHYGTKDKESLFVLTRIK